VATFRRTSAAKHHDPHRIAVGLGQTVDCGGGPNGDRAGGKAAGGIMKTAIAALLLLPVAADAATIEVVPLKNKLFKSVITVSGRLYDSDQKVFREKLASAAQPSIVAFDSLGGALGAGIDIGEQIRARKLVTFVPEMMTCASACALAWLAGWPRYMQGRVGFHAAYDAGPNREVSSVGNALTGAYLNKLGEPYSAIVFITTPPPGSVVWLTRSEASKVDIGFTADDPTAFKEATAPAIKEVEAPAKKIEVKLPREGVKTVADPAIAEPVANRDAKHDKVTRFVLPPPGVLVAPALLLLLGPLPTWTLSGTGKFDKAVP
jgi:hypothetical protein